MKSIRVKKWQILEHDNGVTEFVCDKRALILTPGMSAQEAQATIEAIPKFVLNHYIKLIDKGVIEIGMEEVKE